MLSSIFAVVVIHVICICNILSLELPKFVQAMARMEKMLERIESRQQKADSETKSVYTIYKMY
jgi:hypothetical protein